MTHEEILSMLGDYVDYLIANSSAEAPMWNIEKVRSGKPNKWNYIDGCMRNCPKTSAPALYVQ